jgi:hypothetical protein
MRLYPSQQYTSSLLLTLYFVCLHVYPHDNVKQILPDKKNSLHIFIIYFLWKRILSLFPDPKLGGYKMCASLHGARGFLAQEMYNLLRKEIEE